MSVDRNEFPNAFDGLSVGVRKPVTRICRVSPYSGHKCAHGLVYVAKSGDLYKIGFSNLGGGMRTLEGRIRALSSRVGVPFIFAHGLWSNCGRGLEMYLHSQYRRWRFDFGGNANSRHVPQEVFRLSDGDYLSLLNIQTFNGGNVSHLVSLDEVREFVASWRARA